MPQRTALITGCSDGGIGSALAAQFHLRGLRVFATARDASRMTHLTALGIETIALDVTSDESVAAAVALVREKLSPGGGKLDFLINNAGTNHVLPLLDSKITDLRRLMDTNVVGTLAVTQAFLPLMMRRKEDIDVIGKATVVMLGSVNEIFCPIYQSAYNASKGAVHIIARTLRVELAPLGVNCVTLMTGSVQTKLFDNAPSKVPEHSLYAPVASEVESRDFLKNAQFVSADEFARQAVDDLLKPKPKLAIWRGGLATVASWLAWLGWEGMLDSSMFKENHLDRISLGLGAHLG
ncbi:hypothetical protein GGR57DRAFT_482604 [Xylariaceae sp. FL1272]|nr:hypothetical protein GGR57DRAFT_482604 [Xylariaceae sp. FL1272]